MRNSEIAERVKELDAASPHGTSSSDDFRLPRSELVVSALRVPHSAFLLRVSSAHHNVYVVFLRNPRGDGRAGYYVGMTGLTPEERFENHCSHNATRSRFSNSDSAISAFRGPSSLFVPRSAFRVLLFHWSGCLRVLEALAQEAQHGDLVRPEVAGIVERGVRPLDQRLRERTIQERVDHGRVDCGGRSYVTCRSSRGTRNARSNR